MRTEAEGALHATLKLLIKLGPRDGGTRALQLHRAMVALDELLGAPIAPVIHLERERARRIEGALSPTAQPGALEHHAPLFDAALTAGAHEVLTLAETAKLIRRSVKTTGKLARSGELPGRTVGREWRFIRSAVLEWLKSQERKHGDSRS